MLEFLPQVHPPSERFHHGLSDVRLAISPKQTMFPKEASVFDVEELRTRVCAVVEPAGFEVYPFLIGWYNEVVDPAFRLQYQEDTVAFVIISTPSMFERLFVPFILDREIEGLRDPIDQCMLYYFGKLTEKLFALDIDMLHDFDMHPNRRPKILAQTAAHVAGAAYLYQQERNLSCDQSPVPPKKKLMGVCIHPKYGGWFAIRGCMIMKDITCGSLVRNHAPDVLGTPDKRLSVIELFNFHWRDSRFRDILPVMERYSEDQQKYFNAPPGKRKEILEGIKKRFKPAVSMEN